MVYHGAIKETLPYFTNLGYFCEEHDNPADFLLDVINQCEGLTSATANLLAIESEMVPIDMSDSYLKSRECGDTRREYDRIIERLEKNERGVRFSGLRGKYATNFFWQLFIVMIRSIVNLQM
ncbi:PREDICTED: ATP-binding cassette sub-family G member 2-like [Amphimedon queenslandica]|uniref:Uncharacterized protein n=1 Tax=Amphimedon queenslandica TaxID=400682 RepID=A0AAN0JMK2_AMPQE|nr:PREDICTED: ATP-binding cassette sub-family G member 2-like [Amphimedon queenslandica]|eukprot:XP_019858228.1 PREDICTED: ATP-binding cassette sub-family G member 2-like [Amphimedon queenslandica]